MIINIVGRSDGFKKVYNAEGATWVVSSVFRLFDDPKKVDLIFQLHKPEVWEDWLPKESLRVVTAFPSLYPYREFPAKDLLDKYGAVFGSSIAWMLAYAIEQHPDVINIFGVDMATQEEYIYQRDTFFYFCGRAEAIGIEVNIPQDSRAFFKDRIYGVM